MNCKKCDQTAIDLSIRSLKDIPKVQNVIKESPIILLLFIVLSACILSCSHNGAERKCEFVDKGSYYTNDSSYYKYFFDFLFNTSVFNKEISDYESGKYSAGLCHLAIPDSITAHKIAEIIIARLYGEDTLNNIRPLEITLVDSLVWLINGNIKSSNNPVLLKICSIDGRVIDDKTELPDNIQYSQLTKLLFDSNLLEKEKIDFENGLYDNGKCISIVPDAVTAYKLAKIYLTNIYGGDIIKQETPFEVTLFENLTWEIYGTEGGKYSDVLLTGLDTVTISISRIDGRVIRCCDCPKEKK